MKRCTKCSEEKPPEEFPKDKSRPSGRFPHCKECCRENTSTRYFADHETNKAKRREYFHDPANRDRIHANRVRSYRKHQEKNRQYSREWYKKNKERARATNEEIKRGIPPQRWKEYQRKYRQSEKGRQKAHAHCAKRRAMKKNAPINDLTAAEMAWLKAQYSGRCAYCGKDVGEGNLSIDHIHPLSKGGAHTLSNIAYACISCNSKKHDRTPDEAGMQVAVNINPLESMEQTSFLDKE